MGRLVYLMNTSLDGFVETPDRSLDWSSVDAETHRWFTARTLEADLLVYGRRLYEVMAVWHTIASDPTIPDHMREFAEAWNATPKLVVSSTLSDVGPNCRIIRGDPVDEVLRIRNDVNGDVSIGGPTLAGAFIERGLIDRYDLVVHPVSIGAGLPFFPRLQEPLRLRLVAMDPISGGVVHLGYEPVRD